MNSSKFFKKPLNVFIFALICTVLWGSAYPCIKKGYEIFDIAGDDIPGKLLFAGIRFFFAGLITLAIFALMGNKLEKPDKKTALGIFYVGFIQTFVQYIFFYIGLANTTGVKSSILNSSVTFFSIILAHFFVAGDRINIKKALGCIVGFAGIIAINIKGFSPGDMSFSLLGDGAVLFAAFAFSLGALVAKIYSEKFSPVLITGYQLTLGGIILTSVGILTGGRLSFAGISGYILLAYMACLSAVAFTLWTILNKYNPMSRVAIYNFLTPVFGTVLSCIFLGENLWELQNLIALVLVCAGIMIVNVKSS